MKAKTIKAQSTEALATELERCTADGFLPTLALVFLSIRQDYKAIAQLLDSKGISVFGATTAGEFIDGEIGEGSVVVMLLDVNPSSFQILFLPIGEDNLPSLAQQVGRVGKNAFPNPAFLISYSGLYTDGEMLVKGIEETAGEATVVFGGMAGDDMTFSGPSVFTNSEASDKGILALIIDSDKITLKGHATSGWKPVGTERTVTSSKGSVVYTIDEEPAVDVVMKFFGIDTTLPGEREDALSKLGGYFTILLHRANGDPVARTSMFAMADEGCLKFSGNVPQGAKFRFSLPPDFDVVDKVVDQSGKVKKTQLEEADALVLFSCVSRRLSLGPMVSEEIDGLKKVWNAPLVGFFSYGEIGKATNGKHEFHNNTCCLVAMKEKELSAT